MQVDYWNDQHQANNSLLTVSKPCQRSKNQHLQTMIVLNFPSHTVIFSPEHSTKQRGFWEISFFFEKSVQFQKLHSNYFQTE